MRLSLDKKIAYCQQFGTLKTLSKDEALAWKRDIYKDSDMLEEELREVRRAYASGKYYCAFIAHDELETVYQINTLGDFVRLVYFILNDD